MATSYAVVLDNLIVVSNGLDAAAADLLTVTQMVDRSTELGSDALGILGRLSKFPEKYEEVRTKFKERLSDGYTVLSVAAGEVLAAEQRYAAQDSAWWQKYGYIKDNMRPTQTPTADQGKQV